MERLLDLREWFTWKYEEFMWKNGEARKQQAHERLIAHDLAMKEGRNSPYTHPEEYDYI